MKETKEEIIKRILDYENLITEKKKAKEKKYIEINIDRKNIGKTQKERDEIKC